MKHPPTRPTTQSSKNVWIGSAIAATTIAAIMALIQTKKDEAINPISSATVTAPASRVLAPHFSIKNGDMDDIIVARMDTLGQSHPTIVRLWSLIRQTPNIHIAFVSRETYIDGQVGLGWQRNIIENELSTSGAVTSVMSDQKYLQNPSIKTSYVVHIPESTLTDDSAYIQGMANEGINIFLDSFMPTVLEKKKRSVGTDGNINFTKTDINGLALELFKEMMSDIFSITIVSAKDRYPSPIMVAEIRAASYDGRFSSTNTPDYARKYFGRILSEYGFPPLGDQTEGLYRAVLDELWKNEKTIHQLGNYLGIQIQ